MGGMGKRTRLPVASSARTTRANEFANATRVDAGCKVLDPFDVPTERPRNRIVSRDQRTAQQLLRRLDVVFRFKPARLAIDLDQCLEAILVPQKPPPLRRHLRPEPR